MPQPLKDSIITMATSQGSLRGSLADVILAAETGDLDDLPAMRPHQRGQVVTACAVLLHLVRRYGGLPVSDESIKQALADLPPLPLYPASPSEPGFMQMAFPNGTGKKPKEAGWQELDPMFFGVGHFSKSSAYEAPTEETVLFSLMSTGDRRYVLHHPNGPRWGMMAVLPSEDGTIGSEIRTLADAYDEALSKELHGGRKWKKPASIGDHMPFLLPGDAVLEFSDMAWPPLDTFRPVRVTKGNGPVRASVLTDARRCAKPLVEEGLSDPHVATTKKGAFRAFGRPLDHHHVHAALFGRLTPSKKKKKADNPTQVVSPAPIIGFSAAAKAKLVRIAATGTDNGKTLGFRDQSYRVPSTGGGASLRKSGNGDAIGLASRYVREISSQIAGIVGNTAKLVSQFLEQECRDEFERLTKSAGIEWAWSITDSDSFENSKEDFNRILRRGALDAFDKVTAEARSTGHGWLMTAKCRAMLERRCQKAIPIDEAKNDRSHEVQECSGAGWKHAMRAMSVAVGVGPSTSHAAKTIRSSSNGPMTIEHWRIITAAGFNDSEALRLAGAIRTVIDCAATVPHGQKARIASDLHALGISDMRMERLLEDTGEALRQGVLDLAYAAKSKGLTSFDWRFPGGLCLADAAGDVEAVQDLKGRIALAYCRNTPKSRN